MFKFVATFVTLALLGNTVFAAVPEKSGGIGKSSAATKSAKKMAKVGPPLALPLTPLSDEHRDIASRVSAGPVSCDKGESVHLQPHASSDGRFVLSHSKQKFVMEPTLTTTGAIRLEDPLTGVVWLQLANKSMLLNQRLGKRLADGCMTQGQAAVALAMESGEVPGLLDSPKPETSPIAK